MSADNWGICPNPDCTEPVDSFGERRTLREDYEIYFEEGTANCNIYYSGSCECGFSHKYNHQETVKV